ncbi:hypothetical protein ACS0TY_026651 [Phlomoides rotata]
MVFSSIPAYLDPSNWQQNHQIIGSTSTNPNLNPLFPPPPPPPPFGGGGTGSIRPGSMSERARLANIPMPETALKCPRCESTNTKFCYFNNYSLSQPRHFCKTCRRYWTRGGALRSVPVGGGCRRNKRSKSSSSKSPASSVDRQQSNPTSSTAVSTPQLPPLRFVSPLSQLTDNYDAAAGDMGLNYSGMTAPPVGSNEMNFIEPWRLQQFQQFPFMGGLESSAAMYQFHHGGESGFMGGETSSDVRPKLSSQMAAVKMEDRHPERQLLGGGGNEQWNQLTSVNWTDLSSFSSSSTSNNNRAL